MFTDEELVEKIKKGDEQAENQLFKNYKDLVTKISRGYFIVGGELEDIVQEGMIGLYKAINGYNPQKEASFKTFAVLCIKHQIQSAIKKSLANKNKPLSSAVSLQSFDKTSENMDYLPLELVLEITPAERAIDKENFFALKQSIKDCLSSLEIKILNKYLQGYSYKEIATQLNISQKSIDNALTRIKLKLKTNLKQ